MSQTGKKSLVITSIALYFTYFIQTEKEPKLIDSLKKAKAIGLKSRRTNMTREKQKNTLLKGKMINGRKSRNHS